MFLRGLATMKAIRRVVFFLVTFNLFCGYASVIHAQEQSLSGEKQASSAEQPSPQAGSETRSATPQAGKKENDGLSVSFWAALLGALIPLLAYKLNRSVAYRTVTIEAQKLLVEINKQYISDPTLLIIEGEYNGHVKMDVDFNAKLRAMAYLKLNVFEVIFATLPWGQSRNTWKAYFEQSLEKSDLLAKELEKNRKIYHRKLIRAYDKWKKKGTVPVNPPTKPLRKRLFKRRGRSRT
jgi:hypothetical protein